VAVCTGFGNADSKMAASHLEKHRNIQFTIEDGVLQADGMFGLPKT
jgi:hypothetical protein